MSYPLERWIVVENNGDLGNPRVFRPSGKTILTLDGEYLIDVVRYSEYLKAINEVIELRKALEFYQDGSKYQGSGHDPYHVPVAIQDHGQIAKEALKDFYAKFPKVEA